MTRVEDDIARPWARMRGPRKPHLAKLGEPAERARGNLEGVSEPPRLRVPSPESVLHRFGAALSTFA